MTGDESSSAENADPLVSFAESQKSELVPEEIKDSRSGAYPLVKSLKETHLAQSSPCQDTACTSAKITINTIENPQPLFTALTSTATEESWQAGTTKEEGHETDHHQDHVLSSEIMDQIAKGHDSSNTYAALNTTENGQVSEESYKCPDVGIGNVQLFVNLRFILYARWRFKIAKKSNFYRFLTSIFHRHCSLRSQKYSFFGF